MPGRNLERRGTCPDVEFERLNHSCVPRDETSATTWGLACLSKWSFPWPPLLGTKSSCQPTQGLAAPHLWSEPASPAQSPVRAAESPPPPCCRRPHPGNRSRRFQAPLILPGPSGPTATFQTASSCPAVLPEDIRSRCILGTSPQGSTCGGDLVLGGPSLSMLALATPGRSHCPDRKCQQP